MKSKIWEKAGVGVLAVVMMSGLSGCTGDEVAATLAGVAIVAGAAAIVTDPGAVATCEGGMVRTCHEWTDYYNVTRTECEEHWDACASTGYEPIMAELGAPRAAVDKVTWGKGYAMGFDGAQELLNDLNLAKAGNPTALYQLGFTPADVAQMAELRRPGYGAIDAVARNLNQSPDTIIKMIDRIEAQAKKMQAAGTIYTAP